MGGPHTDRAGGTLPAPRRRPRRRWLLFGVAVILVLTVLLAFLPTLLSLGPGRRLLLGVVNRHLTGTLYVDSWSLSWFSGLDLSGVEVRDSGGTPVFAAKGVHVPASVPMLLRSPMDLGAVSIESPQVELARGADGVWNVMRVIATKGGPLPLDVKAEVKGRDGRLSVRTADGPVAAAAELTADVRIQGLNGPIEYSLAGVLGASQAAFRGHGSVKLMEGLEFSPDALSASLNLSLEGFDLAEIVAVARQMGVLPVEGEGSLSATLEAKLEGRRSASAAGHLEVVGLALSGGPLGPDRPAFDRVALDWRVGFDGRSLTVDQLDLSSPAGEAHVTGVFPLGGVASLTGARLTADAKLDAAALASRVPHLLRMQSGLALDRGTFEVSATLAPVEGGIALAAHGRLSGLSALLGDRRVEMSAPLSFEASGALSDAGPRIESLKFESPFAAAEGKGTLADFRLKASADLSALCAELGKFVDLGPLRLAGAVDAQLGISEMGPKRGAERRLAASVALAGLRLEGLTSGPIVVERLSGEAGGVVSLGSRPQVTALHGSVKGDLGECEFEAARVGLGSGPAPGEVSGLQLTASAPLGPLVALCRAAGVLAGDLSVAGDAVVSLRGGLAEGVLNVEGFQAALSQLEFKGSEGLAFAEERVDVTGKGRVNLLERAVDAEQIHVLPASGLFELDARGALSDWSGTRQLKMQGSLTPELALVGGLLKERVGMDLGLGGKQPWPFNLTTALGKGDWRDALRGTSAEAVLSVERFSCLGLAGTGLTAKVHTDEGGLAMDIAGTANDGQIALHPVLQTAGDAPLLTLAAGENRALIGAQITNEMANALLARVIPVFRRPVSVQGRVTAELSDLRVPLGKDLVQRAAMTMKVGFEGVSLKPAGFLSELLGLVGLRDKAVAVPDQTLGVSLQDGRFRQEQMALEVAGHALRLSGSVGLDRTLDLLVELPFTRQLVPSDDLYKLLQGQTLKVRVGGTVDAPQFDRNAVRENIRSLTEQVPLELLKRLLR